MGGGGGVSSCSVWGLASDWRCVWWKAVLIKFRYGHFNGQNIPLICSSIFYSLKNWMISSFNATQLSQKQMSGDMGAKFVNRNRACPHQVWGMGEELWGGDKGMVGCMTAGGIERSPESIHDCKKQRSIFDEKKEDKTAHLIPLLLSFHTLC